MAKKSSTSGGSVSAKANPASKSMSGAGDPVVVAPLAPEVPAQPAFPVERKLKNRVCLVVDRSGSMGSRKKQAIQVLNAQIKTLQEKAAETGQETTLSLVFYDSFVETKFFNVPIEQVKPLGNKDYEPQNLTALFDGECEAINVLRSLPDADDEDVSFVVVNISDGAPYGQQTHTAASMMEMVLECINTTRWTFAFLVPSGDVTSFCRNHSVPEDLVSGWQLTEKGMQQGSQATAAGISRFYTARATGQSSVRSFYTAPDLSHVTKKSVKEALDNLTSKFEILRVPAIVSGVDEKIRGFVEARLGMFRKGSVFYELTEREEVQADKEVVVMDKATDRIYGGPEARDLIGLPAGSKVRVSPGDHGGFRIFIQSNSYNRKPDPDTLVLVRKV